MLLCRDTYLLQPDASYSCEVARDGCCRRSDRRLLWLVPDQWGCRSGPNAALFKADAPAPVAEWDWPAAVQVVLPVNGDPYIGMLENVQKFAARK